MSGKKRDRDGEEVTSASGAPLSAEFYFPLAQAQQAKEHLRTYGVVVVQGALPAEEARVALNAIQNWLAEWTSKGGFPNGNGLVAAGGAGQCEGAWRARGATGVQDVFANIWNVPRRDALLTSMDALILWRERTQGVSLHRDRPDSLYLESGLLSSVPRPDDLGVLPIRLVQSLCVLTKSTAETGGFICCPGENFDRRDDLPWKRVHAQPGDLICWDSGCRHGSKPPAPSTPPPVTDMDRASRRQRLPVGPVQPVRVAVPICMVPKSWVKQDLLPMRRTLFESGGSANHDSWSVDLFVRHPAPPTRSRAAPDQADWWTANMESVLADQKQQVG